MPRDFFYPFAEAYDKLQGDLVTAKNSLAKILSSEDVKKTVYFLC